MLLRCPCVVQAPRVDAEELVEYFRQYVNNLHTHILPWMRKFSSPYFDDPARVLYGLGLIGSPPRNRHRLAVKPSQAHYGCEHVVEASQGLHDQIAKSSRIIGKASSFLGEDSKPLRRIRSCYSRGPWSLREGFAAGSLIK